MCQGLTHLLGDVVQSLSARQLGVDLGGLAVGDHRPPHRRRRLLRRRRTRRQLAPQSVLGFRLRRLENRKWVLMNCSRLNSLERATDLSAQVGPKFDQDSLLLAVPAFARCYNSTFFWSWNWSYIYIK